MLWEEGIGRMGRELTDRDLYEQSPSGSQRDIYAVMGCDPERGLSDDDMENGRGSEDDLEQCIERYIEEAACKETTVEEEGNTPQAPPGHRYMRAPTGYDRSKDDLRFC